MLISESRGRKLGGQSGPGLSLLLNSSGNLLPDEVESISKDRMDMIARYLERRAKTATP